MCSRVECIFKPMSLSYYNWLFLLLVFIEEHLIILSCFLHLDLGSGCNCVNVATLTYVDGGLCCYVVFLCCFRQYLEEFEWL